MLRFGHKLLLPKAESAFSIYTQGCDPRTRCNPSAPTRGISSFAISLIFRIFCN